MHRLRLALSTLAVLLPACALDRPLAPAGPPARAQEVRVCAAVGDELRDFIGWIDPHTGDTLVAGRPLRDVIPATEYAEDQRWFEEHEVVRVAPHPYRYMKYGLPRSLSPSDLREPGLRWVGKVRGVDVFVERDQKEMRNAVIYVAFSAGCIFQPYEDTALYGPVRG